MGRSDGGNFEQFPGDPTSVARYYGRDWRIEVKGPDAVDEKAEGTKKSASSRRRALPASARRPSSFKNKRAAVAQNTGNASRLDEHGQSPVSLLIPRFVSARPSVLIKSRDFD